MAQLEAGVARCDITPPVGISHANWGAQTHERAAGVDRPLWATALALSDGDETVAIVDLDLLFLWEDDARRVREAVADLAGLPESNVRISYTHTHSGPTVRRDAWVDAGAEMVGPYLDSLPHRVAGAAWEAVESVEPARLRAGTGTCDIGVNRRFRRPEDGTVIVGRNPDGPVDHEVGVLRIDATDGAPLAAVANYACHPITVGPDNDLLTPDYPGVVKRTVEDATGATCLFLQGATGDVGPVRGCARNGIEWYGPLGRRLGHEVARVWESIDPADAGERYVDTLESGAPLAVYEPVEVDEPDRTIRVDARELDLPLKDLPDPEAMEALYDDHHDRLQRLRADGGPEDEIRRETFRCKRLKLRAGIARRMEGRTHLSYELQTIAVGNEVALAAIPGEPFVETGMAVKDGSPFDWTAFSGYSNAGYHAYIPTADQYPDEPGEADPAGYPPEGYEVSITPFAPTAAGRIVDETTAALSELR